MDNNRNASTTERDVWNIENARVPANVKGKGME